MKSIFTCLLTIFGLLSTITASAQKVGIGTNTPTQTLDVNGGLRIRGLSGTDTRLIQALPDGSFSVGGAMPAVTVLTAPTNLGSVSVASPQGVAVQGNLLYVTQQTPNQLRVFDITSPTVLTPVGSAVTGGSGLDLLTISGNYVYVCDLYDNLIRVYTTAGAGTPTTPAFVTTVNTAGYPNGATVVGNFLYISCYGPGTIQRFDITNPASPVLAGSNTVGLGVAGIVAYNGYLYAAKYDNNALQTFSVNTTTGALTSIDVLTVGTQPNAVAVANNLLYMTNSGDNTLQVFTLSASGIPTNLGISPTGGRPYGFAVKGNYAYISNTTSNTVEVRQLTQSNALGFDEEGNITSLPISKLGDNLGNHTATTNINLNGSQLVGGTLGSPGTSGIFVDPTGRVGVNTILPTAKLDIAGGADATGANDPSALAFGLRTGGYRHFVRSRHNSTLGSGGNSIDFYLNNSATANGSTLGGTGNTQVMTLENYGSTARVGIGTTAPEATLHVAGSVRVNGLAGSGSRLVATDLNGNLSATQAADAFILNQTTPQAGANINIGGDAVAGGKGQFGGSISAGGAALTTRLNVEGAGSALPATTGTAQTAGHYARLSDLSSTVLDMGANGTSGNWIQSTNATSLATNYPLLLNPNGGNVGIGNGTTAPAAALDVNGTVKLGTNGTTVNSFMLLQALAPNSVPASLAAFTSTTLIFTVANVSLTTNAVVTASPNINLPAGLIIGYSRVSGTNQVGVRITNYTNAAVTYPTTPAPTFNISVIQ